MVCVVVGVYVNMWNSEEYFRKFSPFTMRKQKLNSEQSHQPRAWFKNLQTWLIYLFCLSFIWDTIGINIKSKGICGPKSQGMVNPKICFVKSRYRTYTKY